jgi:UDP-GlcNAc:undecaprenyl-phosphate/decaprenyl-phosphate GlcNAc-1-phosphate transferase
MYIFLTEVFIFAASIFIILKNKNLITKHLSLLDIPSERKVHRKPTPILGGLICFVLLLNFYLITYFYEGHFLNFEYLVISSVLFFIGIYDDSRDLNAILKLILVGLCFYFFLINFANFNLIYLNIMSLNILINTGKFSTIFTILCLLLLINASNMIDGINGLFIGVNTMLFIYLFYTYDFDGNFIFSIIFILLLSFYFNFKGVYFMGDSGVYLISSIYGLSLIEAYHSASSSLKSIEEVFILLIIPGLDMFRLFLERILNKKNPFKPDRNHFHHLLKKKFNDKKTLVIYLCFVCVGPVFFQLMIINVLMLILIITISFYYITYCLKKIK